MRVLFTDASKCRRTSHGQGHRLSAVRDPYEDVLIHSWVHTVLLYLSRTAHHLISNITNSGTVASAKKWIITLEKNSRTFVLQNDQALLAWPRSAQFYLRRSIPYTHSYCEQVLTGKTSQMLSCVGEVLFPRRTTPVYDTYRVMICYPAGGGSFCWIYAEEKCGWRMKPENSNYNGRIPMDYPHLQLQFDARLSETVLHSTHILIMMRREIRGYTIGARHCSIKHATVFISVCYYIICVQYHNRQKFVGIRASAVHERYYSAMFR